MRALFGTYVKVSSQLINAVELARSNAEKAPIFELEAHSKKPVNVPFEWTQKPSAAEESLV